MIIARILAVVIGYFIGIFQTGYFYGKKNGIDINKLNVIFEFNSPEAIKQSVYSGKCLSFIPQITIHQELRNQSLKKVTVENLNTKFNYYISYRKNHHFSNAEECFMKFILSKSICFCY